MLKIDFKDRQAHADSMTLSDYYPDTATHTDASQNTDTDTDSDRTCTFQLSTPLAFFDMRQQMPHYRQR